MINTDGVTQAIRGLNKQERAAVSDKLNALYREKYAAYVAKEPTEAAEPIPDLLYWERELKNKFITITEHLPFNELVDFAVCVTSVRDVLIREDAFRATLMEKIHAKDGDVATRVAQDKDYMERTLGEQVLGQPPASATIRRGEPEKDADILAEAKSLIFGDREEQYGHPKKNLGAIADMWAMYLYHKYGAEFPVEAEDVCQMMALLKMCRDFNAPKHDSIVDQAAYIGLIGRLRSSK